MALAPSEAVVPWSDVADLGALGAILGESADDVRAELVGLPRGIGGVALVEGGAPVAAGILVEVELAAAGRLRLSSVSARDPRRGLALVEWGERAARAARARTYMVSTRRAEGLPALLEERGFVVEDALLRLRRGPPRPPPALPAGVEERTLAEAGVAAWVRIDDEAFAGVAFAAQRTVREAERLVASPAFDAGLLRVLVDADGPVAFLRGTLDSSGEGEVESIGVATRARGLGLGRWVLRRCEALLDARGARGVTLRVAESNAPARALYASEGYVQVSRAPAWARVLDHIT
jgi:ribosomal protein S18 acetylase RimI-like enzyme